MVPEHVETGLSVLGGIFGLVCLGPLLILVLLAGRRFDRKMTRDFEAMLMGWAEENRYELIRHERRLLGGPWLINNGHRRVFYVRLWDDQGRIRRGWVRCGDWLFGPRTRQVEVRWEDVPWPPPPPAAGPPPRPAHQDPLWDRWIDE